MRAMNRWIFLSSILSFATTAIHIFAGGPDVHDALLAAGLPTILKTYVSILWHGATAVLVLDSIALLIAAFSRNLRGALVSIVAGQYLAYAALFIGYGLGYLESVLTTPQWTAFVLIPVVALIGVKDRSSGLCAERGGCP